MFAEVKSFCFCMSLAVGAKIVGFSCTILAALATFAYSVPVFRLMYYLPMTTLAFYELMALTSAVQFITGVLLIIGAFRIMNFSRDDNATIATAVAIAESACIYVPTTFVVVTVTTTKKNTKLMRPWATVSWWQSVCLVVLTILGSFVYVMASVHEEVDDDVETTIVVVVYTTYALVIYYAASVVDSYCTELSIGRSSAGEEALIEGAANAKDDIV